MARIGGLVGACLAALALGGCGGSGGDAGSGVSISLDQSSLSFVAEPGSPMPPQQLVTVSFVGAGFEINFAPGAAQADWITVGRGNLSENPRKVAVFASNTNKPRGRYSTVLRFVASNGSAEVFKDLPVTLTIAHDVGPGLLEFNRISGAAIDPSPQSIVVSTDNVPWLATTSAPWLKLNRSSGTGSASIDVSIDGAGLPLGGYFGTVTVSDPVAGVQKAVSVSLDVEPHRLHVTPDGVALSSIPGTSILSRAVKVGENGNVPAKWSAISDQAWLSLGAPNGVTNADLTLTADPTGLADGIHLANVTIQPDGEPGVVNTEIVRVGLYVASSAPAAIVNVPVASVAPGIASDPIRPLVYVTSGGSTIDIYNVHGGGSQGSISIPGSDLRQMTVSSDGSRLFVADHLNSAIVPVELSGLSVGTPFTGIKFNASEFNLGFARPNAIPVLLTSELQVLHPATGALLANFLIADFTAPSGATLAASPEGSSIFAQAKNRNGHDLARFSLLHRNGIPRVRQTHKIVEFGFADDLAVDPTGSRLYSASDNALVYNASDLTLAPFLTGSFAFPSTVEIGPTGKVYFGQLTTFDDNILEFPAGSTTRSMTYKVFGQVVGLAVSGDGSRVIAKNIGQFSPPTLSFVGVIP